MYFHKFYFSLQGLPVFTIPFSSFKLSSFCSSMLSLLFSDCITFLSFKSLFLFCFNEGHFCLFTPQKSYICKPLIFWVIFVILILKVWPTANFSCQILYCISKSIYATIEWEKNICHWMFDCVWLLQFRLVYNHSSNSIV